MIKQLLAGTILLLTLVSSCSILKKTSSEDFEEGFYHMPAKQPYRNTASDSVKDYTIKVKVYLFEESDTLWFVAEPFLQTTLKENFLYPISGDNRSLKLYKKSFDFDVFTTPFKLRLATEGLPQQMNTSFNGSFYFGYRSDRYSVKKSRLSFGAEREKYNKTGFGAGAFVGVGSTFISPITMRNNINYEYDGFVIDYGIAFLAGYRNLSTGFSLGFDFLTDNNRKNWVYQHKPWIGIFIGLNLN